MATRNPASVALPNFKGCDWYEPYRAWTAQKRTVCPFPGLNSAQIYGHGTWDEEEDEFVPGTPIQVEYPA